MAETVASADQGVSDELQIRWAIENWVVWRDAGVWDLFAGLWHPKGRMHATWFEASAADFIAGGKRAAAQGMRGNHMLGGTGVEISVDRAF